MSEAMIPKEKFDKLLHAYQMLAASLDYDMFTARLKATNDRLLYDNVVDEHVIETMTLGPEWRKMTAHETTVYADRYMELTGCKSRRMAVQSAHMHWVRKSDKNFDARVYCEWVCNHHPDDPNPDDADADE